MKIFENKMTRGIEYEEHKAILEAAEILRKAFRNRVFKVSIMGNTAEPDRCYGISFTFDLTQEGYR